MIWGYDLAICPMFLCPWSCGSITRSPGPVAWLLQVNYHRGQGRISNRNLARYWGISSQMGRVLIHSRLFFFTGKLTVTNIDGCGSKPCTPSEPQGWWSSLKNHMISRFWMVLTHTQMWKTSGNSKQMVAFPHRFFRWPRGFPLLSNGPTGPRHNWSFLGLKMCEPLYI